MKPNLIPEINSKQKKYFALCLLTYALGFLALYFIKDKINQNGYTPLAFIAPALLLSTVVAIVWIFYNGPKN